MSPQVYNDNLVYVRDQALPVGWQLNPVLKWHAYGHNESQMAGVAAKFGAVSVRTSGVAAEPSQGCCGCTLLRMCTASTAHRCLCLRQAVPACAQVQTNEVARAVWAAANKAGIQRPVIWRLMNDEGPANYSAILEAAKSGMGIQVGQFAVLVIVAGRHANQLFQAALAHSRDRVPHTGQRKHRHRIQRVNPRRAGWLQPRMAKPAAQTLCSSALLCVQHSPLGA